MGRRPPTNLLIEITFQRRRKNFVFFIAEGLIELSIRLKRIDFQTPFTISGK